MRFPLTFLAVFSAGVHGIAPIFGRDLANAVPNSYIVVLKKNVLGETFRSHVDWADGILKTNGAKSRSKSFDLKGFKGYTIQASEAVATELAQSDEVDYIEADRIVTLETSTPSAPPQVSKRDLQANAPWNLGRISHRAKGSTDFVFTRTLGTFIYVLDTGVRISHQLFQGRASVGFNAVGGSNEDLNGHGTHLAGTASSQTYGVVRFANIIAVKVLGDNGASSISVIISGINWTVQDIQTRGRVGKATALLAVGGAKSTALNSAVAAASNAGVMFAVPAGSSAADASNFSPASEPSACTVGGTTINDAVMSSSNYGPALDIYAPGQNIVSLWITSDTAVNTLSGTSAVAHIAGLGAYFLALEGPRGAVELCNRLREVATKNVLTGVPTGTSNLLAYNLSGL